MVIALALMQAAAIAPVPVAPPEPMVLRAPARPKWEDIPRPYRTAAEDCVWGQVQERIAPITGQIDAPLAEAIGQDAVAACDTSISAWADSRTTEVRAGELPEAIKRRYQDHLAARGREFALGQSERFYIAEDRGEKTVPGFRMSYSCEARIRRAAQLRLNNATQIDALVEELRALPAEERNSLQNRERFLQLAAEIESNENRIAVTRRRCPEMGRPGVVQPAEVSLGSNDND